MAKVLILGAGIIGVATAYFLREKGHEVAVIDASPGPGEGASFANGAQLSYSKTYPLSNPKTVKSIPKLMLMKESPIRLKRIDFELISWGLKFLGQSTPVKAAKNAEEVLKMGLRSRELMHIITQRHALNFDYERTGKIFMFTNQADFDAAKHLAESYDHMGLSQKILNPGEAVVLEPALAAMEKQMAGVIYSDIDESGDAKKFCEEMTKLLIGAGVNFVWNKRLSSIVTENGRIKNIDGIEADAYVDCLGIGSNKLLSQIGEKLPIYPMKGYSITAKATSMAPKISITDEGRKVVYSKIGDRLRIAGIAEFAGYNKTISAKVVSKMTKNAQNCFPNSADYSEVTAWTGLRPMTPSTVPIIGKSKKYQNLYFNTGHGMLGWTLATGSAEKLATLID
jgi:D-amino-acid dehydrogenase